MSEVVAGIPIPDSKLAREATELLREHGTPLLFAHSLRVYLFGALRGRSRGLAVDHELLYFGAVFHDLGLTAKYRSPDHRFEVDSANAARVTGGVEADVLGDGLDEIPAGDRDAVLATYPRIDFKRGIVRAFADGFAHKPATTFGTMNSDVLERTLPGYRRPNFCDLIAANPLGG